MMVRLGIPASFRRFSRVASEVGSPILVSANALRRNGRFRHPSPTLFGGADAALDSAGFVAMFRYGGYQWSVADYVALAGSYPWTWWAAMDLCCEPEIATDREEVFRRLAGTVGLLRECLVEAMVREIAFPMPVLQGWRPEHYERCADMMGPLPQLVGVGSMCRRQLGGPDGVIAIVNHLDRALDRHVRLHLFGVKGSAIGALAGHPRIASIDSMAWDRAARWEASKGKFSCSMTHRENHLRRWRAGQTDQLGLFAANTAGQT